VRHKHLKATRRQIAERKKHQKVVVLKIVNSRPTSVNAAARAIAGGLGITVEAARSRIRCAAKHPERAHGNRLLTDAQEMMLTAGLEAASIVHTPLSKHEFISFAQDCFPVLHNRSSKKWAKSFLERHSEKLSVRTVKGLASARISPATLEDVMSWAHAWRNYLDQYGLSEKYLVNVDETRLKITIGNPNRKAITSKRLHKFSVKESRAGGIASYLPFICADGSVIMDAFILPIALRGRVQIPTSQLRRQTRGSHKTVWAFTDSGCIDAALFLKCLQKFREIFAEAHPGLDPVVILDNLSAHKTRAVLEWATRLHVHLFFLPPDTTHFLNPLDAEAFTVLKRTLEAEFNKHVASIAASGRSIAEAVLAIAMKARTHLTSTVISASYASTGIYPWNEQLVITRAKMNIAEIPTEAIPAEDAYTVVLAKMTKALVDAQRNADSSRIKVPCRVAKTGQIYSGEEILDAARKDEETKATKAAEKQACQQKRADRAAERKASSAQRKRQREDMVCRGEHPNSRRPPVYRGGKGWTICRYCSAFYLCPKCSKCLGELLKNHEHNCRQTNDGNSDSGEPDAEDEGASDADMDVTSDDESEEEQPLKRSKK